MSVLRDVAERATIEDFVEARNETLKLLKQGLDLCERARDRSTQYVRYGFPTDVIPRLGYEEAKREIDQRWWRHCFRYTGLVELMDEQATREFEASLRDSCPPFTIENIQEMALSMYQQKDAMFLRGIYRAFRQLDSSYRTNDRQRFKVEKKLIISWLFDTWWTGQDTFRVSHYKRDLLNDIDRCICMLMDRPYQAYSLEAAIQEQMVDEATFENDLLRIRGFKNGNGHLYFKSNELLDKVNRAIAEYCGPAIPDDGP